MTVSISDRLIIRPCNGVTVDFPFPFWVQKDADLQVYVRVIATGVLSLISSVNYTTTGISLTVNGAGSVHYNPSGIPLSSANELILVRTVAYTQDIDISNQGGFLPEPIEFQLDRLEMQIQQLAEVSGRSVVAPIGGPGWTIKDIAVGHFWLAGAGHEMIDGGTGNDIANAQGYANAAHQSALDAAVFGSLSYYITAPQYLAPTDGVTDASAQLVAADVAAIAAGKPLFLTPGTYRVNSNIVLSSHVVMFGSLKPNAGVTVTLSGTFESLPVQCFDTSLGGTIVGSPSLRDGKVYAEWWGANPFNSGFNSQPALQKAVTFISQRSVSGGAAKGAILQLLTGWYRIESSVTLASAGIAIQGCGPYATYIYIIGNINGFLINGAQDGSAASYGTRFRGMQFYGDTTKPTAGAQLKFYKAKEFIVEDCWFTNFYQGVDCLNCQGPLIKELRGLNFVTSAALPTIASSGCILLRGEPAGTGTTICENFHITNCIGAPTICIDFGIFVDGADTLHLNGNHFAGQKIATLYIASGSCNVYNIHSANNCWEGLNNFSQYALYIANSGAATMNCFMFSTDQFLNGSVSMIAISGTGANFVNHVVIGDCELLQALANGVVVNNAKSVIINGNAMTDGDILAAGGKSWVILGGGATDPVDVIVTDNVMGNEYGGGTVANGVNLVGGGAIVVKDNIIRDVTTAVNNAVGGNATVRDNRTSMSATVVSATTITVPLGPDQVFLTGAVQIDFIATSGQAFMRRIGLRLGSGLTIRHNQGASGFWLTGGASAVLNAGSWLWVEWDNTNSRWVETGRAAL